MPLKRRPDSHATLSRRDREIVALRAQGLTLREIGERFALSRQRVAQILSRAATHAPADLAAACSVGEDQRATRRSGEADQRSRSLSLIPPDRGQSRAGAAERRALVSRLLTEGLSPSEIAARLDCRLTTIYLDLAWIRAADA